MHASRACYVFRGNMSSHMLLPPFPPAQQVTNLRASQSCLFGFHHKTVAPWNIKASRAGRPDLASNNPILAFNSTNNRREEPMCGAIQPTTQTHSMRQDPLAEEFALLLKGKTRETACHMMCWHFLSGGLECNRQASLELAPHW